MIEIKNVETLLEQDNYYGIVRDFKKLWTLKEKYQKETVSAYYTKKVYNEILYRYEDVLNLRKYHMIHLNM